MAPGRVQDALCQIIGTDHDGGPGLQVEEDGNVKVVGHRQDPQHSVFGGQPQPIVGGCDAFDHGTVSEQHALGRACRARGEPHECCILEPRRQRPRGTVQRRKAQTKAAG